MEINNCPFCQFESEIWNDDQACFVWCKYCSARGPRLYWKNGERTEETIRRAANAWNIRPGFYYLDENNNVVIE